MRNTDMGAVRPSVKLTNTVDDELVRQGLLAPKHLRQIEMQALGEAGPASGLQKPAASPQSSSSRLSRCHD